MDKVDPLSSPLGHPLVDVPEYLAGPRYIHSWQALCTMTYNICKKEGKNTKDAIVTAILPGYIADSATGSLVFKTATSSQEKKRGE